MWLDLECKKEFQMIEIRNRSVSSNVLEIYAHEFQVL